MIIELFGSPGSGKTYAINVMQPGTRPKNIHNSISFRSKAIELIKKIIIFLPYSFRVRKVIRCELNADLSTYKPIYKPVQINDFINNISMLAFVYKYSKKDVFMDEGIVHRVISMCINYDISKEICASIIKSLEFALVSTKSIYLDVNEAECINSIKNRNRHEVAIDELEGDNLVRFLSLYQLYCNYICNRFDYFRLKRSEIYNWKDLVL